MYSMLSYIQHYGFQKASLPVLIGETFLFPEWTLFGCRYNPFGLYVEPSVERVLHGTQSGFYLEPEGVFQRLLLCSQLKNPFRFYIAPFFSKSVMLFQCIPVLSCIHGQNIPPSPLGGHPDHNNHLTQGNLQLHCHHNLLNVKHNPYMYIVEHLHVQIAFDFKQDIKQYYFNDNVKVIIQIRE